MIILDQIMRPHVINAKLAFICFCLFASDLVEEEDQVATVVSCQLPYLLRAVKQKVIASSRPIYIS